MRAILAAALLSVLAVGPAAGRRMAPVETGFLFRAIRTDGREYRYAVYVPREYDPTRDWPAIVFLNGSGECGTDGQKQLAVGLGPAILTHPERWPFIVIFPQKPDQKSTWEDHDAAVMSMLDGAEREWKLDRARIYLTGLSQGGHGTWTIAALHPDRFAAIAPVCGYGDAAVLGPKLKAVPAWAFHGERDSVVPVQESRSMTRAVQDAGGQARLTTYPGVDHSSWEQAYAEEELPKWLLSKSRERP